MMKKLIMLVALSFCAFSFVETTQSPDSVKSEMLVSSSFTLINDTKEAVSIHTGTGFTTLNKGSKTSIGCNVGKEVRWADKGKKGGLIFKIKSDMCGKTIKLSEYVN